MTSRRAFLAAALLLSVTLSGCLLLETARIPTGYRERGCTDAEWADGLLFLRPSKPSFRIGENITFERYLVNPASRNGTYLDDGYHIEVHTLERDGLRRVHSDGVNYLLVAGSEEQVEANGTVRLRELRLFTSGDRWSTSDRMQPGTYVVFARTGHLHWNGSAESTPACGETTLTLV